jgi:hypothetical protein
MPPANFDLQPPLELGIFLPQGRNHVDHRVFFGRELAAPHLAAQKLNGAGVVQRNLYPVCHGAFLAAILSRHALQE